MDGWKDLHNRYRVDEQGKGSWNRAVRAAELLRRAGVRHNALCVITGPCAVHPERAYRELRKLGFSYLQFIACLDPIGAERGSMEYSLTPEAYRDFLCRLFDLWFDDWAAGRYCSIRLFDDYVHMFLGDGPGSCATCGRCGNYFAVEGDGTVYPCDFFMLDEWRMGRFGEDSLQSMTESAAAKAFLERGRTSPAECAACRWNAVCGGGCKNDWYVGDGGDPHNYYCGTFRGFLDYAAPKLRYIAAQEAALRRRV